MACSENGQLGKARDDALKTVKLAGVAESVDATDLKSVFPKGSAGSSPVPGTTSFHSPFFGDFFLASFSVHPVAV